MSGGLAPSKSTVYLSNLPFSLTNNDLCKILEKYGKVVKVTIVKDKVTRRSKGVAFVLFIEKESAHKCCHALNQTVMFGRTIRCNIARDNGRAAEFIRRKEYPDKSKCYECGEEGHLSYKCPKNLLGEREQPKKKDKKRRKEQEEDATYEDSDKESVTWEDPKQDSLAAAIQYQQLKNQDDLGYHGSALVLASASQDEDEPKKKRYKKDAYFSDEEEFADD